MKKYFLLAAAAATVLAVSCNKEKEQPKVDPTPTEIEDNTPQPIRFGTNIAEVKAPITKSAIENAGWNGEDLYIYGLEYDGTNVLATNVGTNDTPDYKPYINEVKAIAPTGTGEGNDRFRDPINVYKDADNNLYYYYQGKTVYNFYGYYVGKAKVGNDDAAGTAVETINENTHVVTSIAIENMEIDGTNDIMIATTDKFEDYLYAQSRPGANVTVSPEKIYSATSARQGVVPDLAFKHLLSRFVFETAYGGAQNDQYNANRAKVKINSLKLESQYTGTFTVLGANPGFVATDAEKEFTLEGLTEPVSPGKDKDDNANPAVGYGAFAPLGNIGENKTASILAVPKAGTAAAPAKYKLILNVSQFDNSATPVELDNQDVELDVDMSKIENANYSAEAGKQYRVKIVVYGLEEIQVTVSLEAWGEVGETILDYDQDDRTAVTITTGVANDEQAVTVGTPVNVTGANVEGAAWEEVQMTSSNTAIATVEKSADEGKYTITGVKAGTAKIYIYVPATTGENAHKGALKAVTVTVSGATAPLPKPEFAGAPGQITIDQSDLSTQNFVANLFTSCQYNSTDVAADKISIELKDADGNTVDASVSALFVFDATATTVTVAANSDWAKVSSVKIIVLKAAESDGVHQAADNVEITVNTQE